MEEDAYRRAQARVEAKLGFYRHAIIYVIVNLFLIVLNLMRDPEHLWFIWPALGWGIGLTAHGLSLFWNRWESARKEQMIQREMEKGARARPPTRS